MTMLDHVTPVLLTYNEEANIARTLDRLDWAKEIIVVDSGSTDGTVDVLRRYDRVRMFTRVFDTHAGQWRFAVRETGISSEWILRLDADYLVSESLRDEILRLYPAADVAAFRISFGYAIFGRPLRASLYPSNTILLRNGRYTVYDRGHTEAWRVDGRVEDLKGLVIHDDRKTSAQFVAAQIRYMTRERETLDEPGKSLKRQLRVLPPLMPFFAFAYAFIGKGLFLNGRAGLYYALQRLVAEAILALIVLERSMLGGNIDERNSNSHGELRSSEIDDKHHARSHRP